jgi:ABC-type oligopeptide transport system ATPase subunit
VPTFVVADEPTSMLDVSIRTGIMKLMQSLAEQMGALIFIMHDLAVACICRTGWRDVSGEDRRDGDIEELCW